MTRTFLPSDEKPATPPPSADEAWRREYNEWFEAAIARSRTAENTLTYEALIAIINESYERLSISQSEGGSVPSKAGFEGLMPVLKKMRLTQLNQSADQLEEVTIAFLHTIPKENARKLIHQLMLGRPTGNFFDKLEDLELTLLPEVESPELAPEPPKPRPSRLLHGDTPGDNIPMLQPGYYHGKK